MTVRDLTDDERRAVHNALHNSVVLVEDPEVIALRARVAELEAAVGQAAVALQGRQYDHALAWLIAAMPKEPKP